MSKQEIQRWLQELLAKELNKQANEISTSLPISQLGVDSIIMVRIAADLEEKVGFYIDPSVFWEFDHIEALSEWVAQKRK